MIENHWGRENMFRGVRGLPLFGENGVSYERVTKWYRDDFALGKTKNSVVTYVARTETERKWAANYVKTADLLSMKIIR